ncbi:MAG: terpene cyclase/mutase family protein [Lentisphaeria bacterium]|nr:terpene cyclase/mutase family protein [Lentisphaeria bacterium]
MQRLSSSMVCLAVLTALTVGVGLCAQTIGEGKRTAGVLPPTLLLESRAAVERGVAALMERQESNGSWLHSPAVTALACVALQHGHAPKYGIGRERSVERARRFVLANVRDDGAICTADRAYVNYSTAICLATLALLDNPADIEIMRKARTFLIASQLDEDHAKHPTSKDDPFYGGIGYGSRGPMRPDLSNTQWALEALALTDHLAREPIAVDPKEAEQADLAWAKALRFLEAVQNIEKTKDGAWIVSKKKDGGFVYQPDKSKASDKQGDKEALRSYGTMTYAGLKSMIYAKLKRDDPRVKAAMDWARKNYVLTENPGMGDEGYFYYLHTFAKAHSVYGDDTLVTPDGKKHAWRVDLARQLLRTQKGDGTWINEKSGRWQESMPELVTSYALMALELALGERVPAND